METPLTQQEWWQFLKWEQGGRFLSIIVRNEPYSPLIMLPEELVAAIHLFYGEQKCVETSCICYQEGLTEERGGKPFEPDHD